MDDDAWSQGYDAYYKRIPLIDCPYSPQEEPQECTDWNEGWKDAERDGDGRQ